MNATGSTDSDFVTLCEVGPRDGFQFEDHPIPTSAKVDVIRRLAAAGLPQIQVTSFVHPQWVPQMADAEDVVAALRSDPDGRFSSESGTTRISALALNERGVRRAADSGVAFVDLSIATNETHSRSNANMSVAEGVQAAEMMIALAVDSGMQAQIGLQTVFGFESPGDTSLAFVVELAARLCELPVESLSLADSTGMANPSAIKTVVRAVQAVSGDVPLVLHLHDTRGLGLANVVAGLEAGVRRFDTSVGGLGGCPFIPGATGNIATEDTAYLLESMGYKTGVNREAVGAIARELEQLLGHSLSGRLYRL